MAEATIRAQEQSLKNFRTEHDEKVKEIKGAHQREMQAAEQRHNLEKEEFVQHLSAAENTVVELRSELEKRMKAQSELVRKLAAQEELTQSLLSQQTSDERLHTRTKQELVGASNKIVALQDEVRRLAGKNAALEEACQNLRIEENKWKRVDKLKLEQDLKDLQDQNTNMRDQLRAVRGNQGSAAMSNDVAMERIRELEAANQKLEMENLRRRGELEAAGLEHPPSGTRNIYTLANDDGEGIGGPKAEIKRLKQSNAELQMLLEQTTKDLKLSEERIAGELPGFAAIFLCSCVYCACDMPLRI
jgi:hypothetical protein